MDFPSVKDKIKKGLVQEILEKLKHDGLEIKYICGQGYDNGATWLANIM